MTEREAELLEALLAADPAPLRPLDLGGSDSSDHSKVLRRMVPKGWVHAFTRPGMGNPHRPSYVYAITARGSQALANHKAIRMLGRTVT